MKGDFSRIRFEPQQHYTDVLDQQGRVAYDADHNEQRFIDAHRRTTETIDVIGEYGAPMDDAGFAISFAGTTLSIGAGRYYVHGLLCENDEALAYDEQPFLMASADLTGMLEELLRMQGTGCVQVFLEVWQRMVTALDDTCLGEPALGQADTTVRLQTVWRVVANLVTTQPPSQGNATLAGGASTATTTATLSTLGALSGRTVLDTLGLESTASRAQLIRDEATLASLSLSQPATNTTLTKTGLALNPAALAAALALESGTSAPSTPAASSAGATQTPATCSCTAMYAATPAAHSGTLSAQVSTGGADCGCQPIPAAGYTGLENQLYRIEIQLGGPLGAATFKWSRENGSVAVAVLSVSGKKVKVASLGMDANLGFQEGQWVELSDDTYEFGDVPDQPGLLYQIQQIDRPSMTLTMTTTVQSVDPTRHARMRRWDQSGTGAGASGVPLSSGWTTLENGIQVCFGTGTYYAGDAWTIAARTATGQIDWPPCGSDGNPFQPPHYTHVYCAPLACIHANLRREEAALAHYTPFAIDDCRRLFPSLTDLGGFVSAQSLHVTGINWSNDDVLTFDTLVANGLQVQLDGTPTGPLSPANFIVTLETPLALGSTDTATNLAAGATSLQGLTVARYPFILDSAVAQDGTTLSWTLPGASAGKRQISELATIDRSLAAFVQMGAPARARVKLPGHMIYALNAQGSQIWLDGQAFGQTGTLASGNGERVDLSLPSGDGERASDFESWFYLYPTLAVQSVAFTYQALVVESINGTPTINSTTPAATTQPIVQQATITLNYAAVQATTIQLSMTGDASVASVPSSVAVNVGESSVSVDVSINGVPASGPARTYVLTASLPSALGQASSQSASFTIVGRGGRRLVETAPSLTLNPQAATPATKTAAKTPATKATATKTTAAKTTRATTRRASTKPTGNG
ncbi:MAG TPA: DUF6519 domain-containing protein [Paraburkholderia sp.]|uniref:DUF6519 domain-containing protein n=1 Tax=Paraburkholderia sp. TaxID=1926495 RepID=UPI002C6EFF88|nr:DUF6519 domain-containing protein [Paraburkholderia sp.]HTR10456.1 DUF6519 domain-containing protein [Paraburkholderia sp.]